jgi:phosphatidylinositol alpha 1,6-mannosyltransferase
MTQGRPYRWWHKLLLNELADRRSGLARIRSRFGELDIPARPVQHHVIEEEGREKLRVVVVAETFLPRVNGVTNSVLRVLEHFQAQGHEVLVLAPGKDTPDSYAGAMVVSVPGVSFPLYRQYKLGVATRRSIIETLEEFDPDVVHVASPFVLGAVALRAAEWLGIPSVAIYQTDVAGFATRYHLTVAADVIWNHIVRVHERAHATLAPSRPAVADLQKRGVSHVSLWPRGVDAVRFNPQQRDESLRLRWKEGYGDDAMVVGFVGRVAREKNVSALAVLDDMPNVRVVVIGDGPYRAELERELPLAHFEGFLEGDDLARAVASLDIMIHTGEHETFCQSVQEALAAEVPVVAPASGGPLDLVTPGLNGWLYEPGNTADLKRCVTLLLDEETRRRFGAAGRVSVLPRSWEAVCSQLVEVYRSIIRAVAQGAA